MATDYYDRVTIEHFYSSRDLIGSGCVGIDLGTYEEGTVTNIQFEYWNEALAFARWFFMSDAPSPESEARWKRLLEEATIPWAYGDENSNKRANEHKVQSPASEDELVREGILKPEPLFAR